MARLGDVCKIQSGGTPSRSNASYWKNGTVPWVKISDIHGKYLNEVEEYITEEGLANSSAKIFPSGTILYTIFATLGDVCVLNIDAATNQAIAGIQITSDLVDADYLYYYLSSLKNKVNDMGRGVAQNNINMTMLRDFEIPLPSPDEQRKIAAVLDKISDLTAKRRRQLDKLDELVKSRFVEMFGDVLLDEKKWQKQRLSEIAEIVDPHPSHRTPPFSKNGIPYIGLTECDYNMYRINFKKARMVSKEILEEHIKRYTIDEGDFIIGKIGTIGKPFWIPKERSYVLSANTLLIKPKTSAVCPAYLFDVFQTTYMKHIIELGMKSTSQPAFGIQKAREIAIPLPPMELQKQYSHFVNYINGIMLNGQKGFDTLSMLRKLLMQKYFCADIEVIE